MNLKSSSAKWRSLYHGFCVSITFIMEQFGECFFCIHNHIWKCDLRKHFISIQLTVMSLYINDVQKFSNINVHTIKKSSFFIQLTMIFLFLKNIYKSSLKHQCSYNNLIIYFISKTQYMCWTMNLHFVLCVRNAYFVPLNCSIESSGILPCYQICCETWQNPWGLGDEFYPKPLQG